ncbi:MAG: class F sortase [Sphaerobacteraceae bacterium]|nr:MAG: class F sortase [Sphaerobacteraceae bacterium]
MRRDLQYKLLTLVFGSIALVMVSACAVASSPTATGDQEPTEQTDSESDASDVDIESVEQVESDPTPVPEVDDADEESSPVEESDDTSDLDDSATSDDASRDDEPEVDETPVPGNPTRLQIDSIGIDAEFEYVGVDDDGNMGVPEEWENVAWYEPGTVPGDQGNSVIAGHYDSDTGPAVFYDLNELEVGDEVRIVTEDGEELTFAITEIESVHVDDADTSKIFGQTDERNLNLITCEGVWDTDAGMYDHRLIVYTTLVDDAG